MDSLRKLTVAAERCFSKVLGVYELQPAETSDSDLLALGKQYGVKFITDDQLDCHDFSYDQPTQEQLNSARGIIVEELSVYPREAIEKTQIEQVILCTNLVVERKPAGGTLKVGLHYVDTLFIDLEDLSTDEMHGRRTLHHELFHAIDFRDTWHGYVDAEWTRLQGDQFKYEFDAAAELHRWMGENPQEIRPREFDDPYHRMSTSESDTPGFISDYARYSAAEDKAEVFCHLMVSYDRVMKRASKDAVLKRKVERMKELLLAYIPEMDETFWKRKVSGRKF
jgi:hypothetical protein